MNEFSIKFIAQNEEIKKDSHCYSDLESILNEEIKNIAKKILQKKIEKNEKKKNKKLEKEIENLKIWIKDSKTSKIIKKYNSEIKNLGLEWSEKAKTIKVSMIGLYYYKKTYIACLPKIFKDKKEELESNQEKLKKDFSIIFSTIIKYLKEESNKNQNKSVPEYDDLSHELFDNFYFPGIIDKILDSYTRHKLVFPLRKHENVNNWSNIDWNKTIARSSIFLRNNDDFPIFNKVISHNLNEDKEHIVAKIHAMILNEIFDEFGWLFWNRYIPFIPDLKETLLNEQTPYYLKILKEERSKTNIEWKKETINLLINYLEEKYLESSSAKHWLASGDKLFSKIWERACQVVYGNHLDEEINDHPIIMNYKKSSLIKVKDIFKENDKHDQNTIPDQILIFDNTNKILIIDAKNYEDIKDIKIYKETVYSFYFLDLLLDNNKYQILGNLWKMKKDETKVRIFTCYFCPFVLEEKNFEYLTHKKLNFSGAEEENRDKIKYWDLQNLWFIGVSIIKTFEYYLKTGNNKINLSDFDPEELWKIMKDNINKSN